MGEAAEMAAGAAAVAISGMVQIAAVSPAFSTGFQARPASVWNCYKSLVFPLHSAAAFHIRLGQ